MSTTPCRDEDVRQPPQGGLIYKQIAAVMRDLEAIGKTRRNSQGAGYNFRGIDDLYNEMHEHLSKHGVFTVPRVIAERSEERSSKSGGVLIYRIMHVEYRFYAEDGSYVTCVAIGEAMDSGDKASNKAMSAAHKYALLQVFCIPTEEPKDSENETHEVRPKQAAKTGAKVTTAAAPEVELYMGTKEQRDVLRPLGVAAGYGDKELKDFHAKFLKKPMAEAIEALKLAGKTKTILEGPNADQ